jgi:formylglycine-generating enzyme required for sulfatase activity/predicted Ser/Thr protein kinase
MTVTDCQYALPVGAMVQEYRIIKTLGIGSFGIVYAAENKYFSETVALKEFLPSGVACRKEGAHRVFPLSSENEQAFQWMRRKFLQEAKTLRELGRPDQHPNIVRVRQFIEANDTAYMVMDFEKGKPLSRIIEEQETLKEADLRGVLDALLDGLAHLHAANIWHRDIKPSNILIRPDGSPVLIDFGAARKDVSRETKSFMVFFSPAYAAPEQIYAMGTQGPWTDIYGLGATLYKAVTGVVPTNAAKRLQNENYISAVEAAKGTYQPAFLKAIDAALNLLPKYRPQSVAEWKDLFDAPIETPEDDEETLPVPTELPKKKVKHQALWAGAAIMLALVVVNWWFWFYRPKTLPKSAAEPNKDRALIGAQLNQATPPARMPAQPPAGVQPFVNSLGMQFQYIRPGNFMMGSPPGEPGRLNDETRHRVNLTRPYYIQTTEVTAGQFKQFVQSTTYLTEAEKSGGCWITGNGGGWKQSQGTSWKSPGSTTVGDDLPVVCVTWNDARAFARWLSEKEGRKYRLPTEAEWEYAARAGTSTPFSTGRCLSTGEANYGRVGPQYQMCATAFKDRRNDLVEAGMLAPNPWKLHNIYGNVSEWCLDWYGPYPSKSINNPRGPASGTERVMRGGHWQTDAAGCRCARRWRFPPNLASDVVGFRLMVVP